MVCNWRFPVVGSHQDVLVLVGDLWLRDLISPPLQAFRAETMVERFTARMHVFGWSPPGGNQVDGFPPAVHDS